MKTYPVKKNDVIEVTIQDLTHEGLGVAKVDGYPLFIENTLPGEKAQITVVKVGNKFGYGKVLELLEKSPARVELKDHNLLRTGIAPLQHMRYEDQLLFKQKQIENLLHKVAKLEIPVLPTVGMSQPFGYRNKAQVPVRKLNGELITGFYRKNSHDLVPIEDFYIQDPAIDAAIIAVRDILARFNVKAYNEKDNTGTIRHIMIRRGHYSHEMMVVLVTRTTKLFKSEAMAEAIVAALPEVVSVIQNVNPDKTNIILGSENKVLFGKSYIEDQLLERRYRISAQSFYQVNTSQAEYLYQTAIDMAELTPESIVIDAYAGIGTVGLSLADRVSHVYGMETIPEAVSDAKENAAQNGIENAYYEVGKAEDIMPRWKKAGIEADVVFVDPPRKGLEASFIEATAAMGPKRVVYISCNPATLARDLKLFHELGYEAQKIQPVDLFPQTHHVEAVTVLEKVEN